MAAPHVGSGVGWLGLALVFGGWVVPRGWGEGEGEEEGRRDEGGAFGVFSVWIGVGVFLKACFVVLARTKMKAAAKCDQHCELHYFLNHLRVDRMLFFCFFFLKACFLTMKAASKCDKHCELHDPVYHQKFERMLLFRVILEYLSPECRCL